MKYILVQLFSIGILFAGDYFAPLEPIYTYNIKSSVSGKVVFVNNDIKAKNANNTTIVIIDDKINKIELEQNLIKKQSLEKILKIQKQTLKSFNKVSSKSKLEKDQQEIIVLNTKSNLSDLNIRISNLKDVIKNKNLIEKNNYISNINVKKGDWVNPGTLLYTAQDLSKAKLEIFISFDEIELIKNKTIFINDKKTNLKINKIYKTADKIHISAYKIEIILDNVINFSKLVKISFK